MDRIAHSLPLKTKERAQRYATAQPDQGKENREMHIT